MLLSRSFAVEAWLQAEEAARMAASSAARACWICCWCWAWFSFSATRSQEVVRSMAKVAASRIRRVRGMENLLCEFWGVRDHDAVSSRGSQGCGGASWESEKILHREYGGTAEVNPRKIEA